MTSAPARPPNRRLLRAAASRTHTSGIAGARVFVLGAAHRAAKRAAALRALAAGQHGQRHVAARSRGHERRADGQHAHGFVCTQPVREPQPLRGLTGRDQPAVEQGDRDSEVAEAPVERLALCGIAVAKRRIA
eukprot:scaffold119890_cov78-Phaeocystis_antarctica.AAC.3